MTHYPEHDFPPQLGKAQTNSPASSDERDTKTRKLTGLAWAVYFSGSAVQIREARIDKSGLSDKIKKCLYVISDSYLDLANAAISFLSDYVNAIKAGRMEPVDIPEPPSFDRSRGTLSKFLSDLDGVVKSMIDALRKSEKSEASYYVFVRLDQGIQDLVSTYKAYYPDLLKS